LDIRIEPFSARFLEFISQLGPVPDNRTVSTLLEPE
jgi:hypothetical protein